MKSSILALALLVGSTATLPQPAAVSAAPDLASTTVELDTWAWCGVHPDMPDAVASAKTMAEVAGIDATFGPCIQPTGPYSPAFTADRYAPPDVYHRLVTLNASFGMQTVVYDARMWSSDPTVRNTAINEWLPFVSNIAGWDMGDEFDPAGSEWPILISRWQTVLSDATARTGVAPFANHLMWALDDALSDLPGSDRRTSFTRYFDDKGSHIAREFDDRVEDLLCGVNAFAHQIFIPTSETIRSDMALLRESGCTTYLVFGGHRVFGTNDFGQTSLTNPDGSPTEWAFAVKAGATYTDLAGPRYVPVAPTRLLDTRTGLGERPARSTTPVDVAGRAGVPDDAESAVLSVTVTEPRAAGFLTVWPCSEPRPNAASLTYAAGQTALNLTVVSLGATGEVCLFTQEAGHLVVDLSGYQPRGSQFDTKTPARLLETRTGPGLTTVDGVAAGIGIRPVGTVTELPVAGRGGVDPTATSVAINLTVTEPTAAGFVTVFACGSPIPAAANITFDPGDTVSNAAISALGPGGTLCLYNSSSTHLVVDVTAFAPSTAPYSPVAPARLLDTRPGESTVDGKAARIGLRALGTTTELAVAGRGKVPTDAAVAVLNVTSVAPAAAGFVTAYPCGGGIPGTATLTYAAGETRSALAVVEIGIGGKVCLYNSSATHLVADVSGFFPGG